MKNIIVMNNKILSDKENYQLFGYTYIPMEKETKLPQPQPSAVKRDTFTLAEIRQRLHENRT